MPKVQDNCIQHEERMLSVSGARRRILNGVAPVRESETVVLSQALGRVLARDVRSGIDLPPFDNSAMDGYAARAADVNDPHGCDLRIVGTSLAGRPFEGKAGPGECVRIMTGAVLPEGTDTVIMQERVTLEGETVHVPETHQPGENIRYTGEELRAGAPVLSAGRRLSPADLGVIASLGVADIEVLRPLKVTIFSTGDELQAIGKPLRPGQIYDSNRYVLNGMLSRLAIEPTDLGVIPDRREAVETALRRAAEDTDAVITTGGVSVGEADFVKETLEHLGQVDFWKIAVKPGKPLAFGSLDKAIFFGLPGNPVSVMATFYQFVRPALRKLAGESEYHDILLQAVCATSLRKHAGRAEFQRGILWRDDDGRLLVRSTGAQGSHRLTSMTEGNCFIVLDADCAGVEAGEVVDVQPFHGLV